MFSFSIISYYAFNPLQARVDETINSIHLLKTGISFQEKLENDAAYMASKSDTLSKEYFINEILKNDNWVNEIKNKFGKRQTIRTSGRGATGY